jgi:hypothetical protein
MGIKLLKPQDMSIVRDLLARYGLRPLVNSVAKAADEFLAEGKPVLNEHGEPMDEGDIETAVANLLEGQLY